MRTILGVAALLFASIATPAFAQDLGMSFEDAAYVSCRDTQAMPPESRSAFAVALVKRASAYYGVPYVEGGGLDDQLGTLIRSGCTVYPNAYLFNVTARAFRRLTGASQPAIPATTPIPFETSAFLTCNQYAQMTDEQQDALEYDFAVRAGQRYRIKFADTADGRVKLDDGITPLVYGACFLAPDFHVYAVVSRAVQAAAELHGVNAQ